MEILHKYGDGVMCILRRTLIFAMRRNTPADEGSGSCSGRDGRTCDDRDSSDVSLDRLWLYPQRGRGWKSMAQGRRICGKTGFGNGEKLSGIRQLCVEQRHICLESLTILHYFEELLPDVYACLKQIGAALGTEKEQEVLHEVYPTIPKISVDYGIMERAKGVLMLEGDFGWNDVGGWDTLDAVRTRDACR